MNINVITDATNISNSALLGLSFIFFVSKPPAKLPMQREISPVTAVKEKNTHLIIWNIQQMTHIYKLFACHLRAIVGNTSHIKTFLIPCIQFVLCMDCQFMK